MPDRRDGTPLVVSDGSCTRLSRIPFADHGYDESWLQEQLRQHPDLIPASRIEPVFAPLICIGTEVETASGYLDNLYISPQGYLTVVETKLWRNPEARRQVVAQIIDYAKDVSRWDFDDLDARVRTYSRRQGGTEEGLIDILGQQDLIEKEDEAQIIDTIGENMRKGRMLLVIAGDGITESVESMAGFLSQTPQLLFTLALIEFQLYEMPTSGTLILPQVVARTREVTRAIVRVEGVGASATVELPEGTGEGPTDPPAAKLDEEAFRDGLRRNKVDNDLVDFALEMMRDLENHGCVIEWKTASYVVRAPDPTEEGRKLTLLVVDVTGHAYTGWLSRQLENIGLPKQIALDYAKESADIFGVPVHHKHVDSWGKLPNLRQVREKYEDLRGLIEETVDAIRSAAAAQADEPL
jgi:hypothetical protein